MTTPMPLNFSNVMVRFNGYTHVYDPLNIILSCLYFQNLGNRRNGKSGKWRGSWDSFFTSPIYLWQMLNIVPVALVKESKMVKLFWNLCSQLF
jgi:hypothetical protein